MFFGGLPAIQSVRRIVERRDFHDAVHAEIFEALLAVAGRGEPIDIVTVRDELVQRDAYERIDPAYLRALADLRDPQGPPLAYYFARVVKKKAILRRLVRVNQRR